MTPRCDVRGLCHEINALANMAESPPLQHAPTVSEPSCALLSRELCTSGIAQPLERKALQNRRHGQRQGAAAAQRISRSGVRNIPMALNEAETKARPLGYSVASSSFAPS